MAVVGSAEVVVRAITKKVAKDIQKAFADVRPIVANEGKLAGEAFSKEFGKAINKNLGDHIDNAVHNATKNVKNDLTNDLDGAASSAGKKAGDTLADELTRAGGRGGRGAGRSFAQTFADDFKSAFRRLSDLASLFDILAPAIGVLVAGLSTVVSGLFAMASAASIAAGSLAVLPGIMAAAAQGMFAVKFAFGGISEALKLGGAAQDAAAVGATSASKAAAGAAANTKKLEAAQAALTAAQEDATAAQDALNKARDKAKGGAESQEEAEAALAAAQQARNQVLSDPNASQEQGAAAQKAVDDAQNALDAITRQRNKNQRDIRKAATENDKAQDKLSKAEKARDKASKAAGAGAATSPAVKAANAFQDALAALTPEARAFVLKVLEMREAFKKLGEDIGRKLFPPLTKALDLIQDSSFFDILKKNLEETGAIVGDLGLDLAKAFTTNRNQTLFQKFLEGNNETLAILGKKTKDGTTPLQSLLSIFLKLAVAIQPVTHRFVKWISEVVTGFDKVHSAADFTVFFNQAGNMAKKLGRIFRNIISIIGTLSGASEESGKGLINSFAHSTKQLDKFLKKLDAKGKLQDFFDDAADNLRAIGDLVALITGEFISLGDNEGVKTFSDNIKPGIKDLSDILDKLSSGEGGEALANLFNSVSETLNELTQSGQLATFLNTLSDITDVIGLLAKGFNKIPGSGKLLAAFAVFRAAGFAARILGFAKTFDRVRGALGKLIKAPFAALGRKLGLVSKTPKGGLHKAGVPTTKEGFAAGEKVGDAIARGIAAGIRSNTKVVTAAIDDLADATILAIKTKLGIKSPSIVMERLGDQTADGYVLGLRAGTDNAFRAGEGLGAAAAAGARSVPVVPATVGAGAGAAAAKGATPVIPPTAVKATSTLGKSAGPLSKLGKAFGGLTTALIGLSGPIVLVIGALVALFFGIKALYKHSPEFRKFVDGIVDKLKDLGKWFTDILKKYVLPALNDFFGWVNDNLPKIKKIFEQVWGAIAPIVGFAIKLIKFYITKILIPYYLLIFKIIRRLVPIAKAVFGAFKQYFTNMVKGAKAIWEHILKPVFDGIRDVVQDRINQARKTIQFFKEAFQTVADKVSSIGEGIKSVFTGIKDAVVNTFEGLVDKLKAPLTAVIDFLNNNLIGPLNSVTSKFGLTIPSIPGFSEGGWTGPGGKNKVAGIVHADEFVVNKRARRSIESRAPGLLDNLNAGKFSLGFGGFGPIGDIAGGVADLAGDAVGGIKNLGEKIAKEGLGKVLEELVSGVKSGMGAAGIARSGFINEFIYGILDKLGGAVNNWGGSAGKGALSSGKWGSPLRGSFPITQTANSGHSPPWAIDIGAPDGTPVLAASSGRIISAIDKGAESYGKYLVIQHAKGVTTLYAHLQQWLKGAGSDVVTGQQIAISGHTGGVRSSTGGTGAHLHFELRPGSDTLEELRKRGVKLAKGGIATATPGGILSVIAEAGKNERVEPLDSKGMSKRDKEIFKMLGGGGKGDLTINVNNPERERASTSVSKAIRGKAVASGWGV